MSEYESEPIRGLPGHLPDGEHIVWQGEPDARTFARTALNMGWIAAYFAVLVSAIAAGGLSVGETPAAVLTRAGTLAAAGLVALGLLAAYAWAVARTTVYTITNRRVVIRHGVALPKAFNLPFAQVASAGLKVDGRGVGDIPLQLAGEAKIAYPHLWPHARPWRFSRPEPMLRAIPEAAAVAERLGQALRQAARDGGRPYGVEDAASQPCAVPHALVA